MNLFLKFYVFIKNKFENPWALCILYILLLPLFIIFFKIFIGFFAILSGLFFIFIFIFLFFLAPSIFKKIVERGVINNNRYISPQSEYIKIEKNSQKLLFDQDFPLNAISLNIFRGHIYVKEQDAPSCQIIVSTEKEAVPTSFYVNYDDATLNLTIDQEPYRKERRGEPYIITILLPKGKKIIFLRTRIIDGLFSFRNTSEEIFIETLDIDAVNTKIKLETVSLPIFKINGLNLDLWTDNIFVRYLYLNAGGSILRLNFHPSIANFCGKIKYHSVLSQLYLNKKILKSLSGSQPHTLWKSESGTRSIMISANLLRTILKINVKKNCLKLIEHKKKEKD